jgi:diketogulonate reductase-like aldo/keto reductase
MDWQHVWCIGTAIFSVTSTRPAARGCSAAAVALAWTIRSGKVIAIPESGAVAHVKENAVALSMTLTPEEIQMLEEAHPVSGR